MQREDLLDQLRQIEVARFELKNLEETFMRCLYRRKQSKILDPTLHLKVSRQREGKIAGSF